MSYSAVQPVNGFGDLKFTIKIPEPIGNKTVSIPIEDIVNDVANMAVQAVFPLMIEQLQAQLPNLMKMTYDAAKPYIEQQKADVVLKATKLMKTAETKVETQVEKTTNIAGLLIGLLIVGGAGVVLFSKIKSKKKAALPALVV